MEVGLDRKKCKALGRKKRVLCFVVADLSVGAVVLEC